jgi:hypothetical protein
MTGGLKAAQAPRVADPRRLAELGRKRSEALDAADTALDDAGDYLARIEAGGGRINVRRAALLLDVSRDTLYKRLDAARERRVKAERADLRDARERTTP